MRKQRLISLIMLFAIFLIPKEGYTYVPKEGNISGIIGTGFYRTETSRLSTKTSSPFEGALVLMAIGDINPRGSLEIGVFYMNKLYSVSQDLKNYSERTQQIHVTMGYRHWWDSNLSSSISIYSAYPMGTAEVVNNQFGSTHPNTSVIERVNYGGEVSLQWTLLEDEKNPYSLVSDFRYSHAITKKSDEAADHYGVMLAVRFFIQAKQVRPAADRP